MIILLAS